MSQTAPYKKRLHVYGNDMRRLIPISLDIDPESEEAHKLAKEIEQFYLGNRGLTPQTISLFIGLNTDFYFTTPLTVTNELYMRYQQQCKQYVYEFCLNSKLNFFKKALKMTDVPGAGHFDEVSYLFE
jgi:Carboxylesterase family